MKKDQLIKEIRECCPELMELSRGCMIKTKFGINYAEKRSNGSENIIFYEIGGDIKPNWVPLPNNIKYKIIGHPICLEHLLRYVQNKLHCKVANKYSTEINNNEIEATYHTIEPFAEILYLIDLSKPLEEQPEVLEKIAEVVL